MINSKKPFPVGTAFCYLLSIMLFQFSVHAIVHRLERGGIRLFGDNELEALRVIECLKQSGLEIRDIKQFFAWVTEGSSTYADRKELFEHRRAAVEEQMRALEKTLAMVEFKCWYYEKAMADGSEDEINKMLPDKLPPDIQKIYDKAHSKE